MLIKIFNKETFPAKVCIPDITIEAFRELKYGSGRAEVSEETGKWLILNSHAIEIFDKPKKKKTRDKGVKHGDNSL